MATVLIIGIQLELVYKIIYIQQNKNTPIIKVTFQSSIRYYYLGKRMFIY